MILFNKFKRATYFFNATSLFFLAWLFGETIYFARGSFEGLWDNGFDSFMSNVAHGHYDIISSPLYILRTVISIIDIPFIILAATTTIVTFYFLKKEEITLPERAIKILRVSLIIHLFVIFMLIF